LDSKTPTIEKRVALTEKPANRSPIMYHKWRDLLFLHWSFDPDEIQATLPKGLTVDTFDSKAYIGIVPFFMYGVRPRFIPPHPFISNFLELNFRTYVYDEKGNPGIWFYSLDANRRLAVGAARLTFGLPYFLAKMRASKDRETGEISFYSKRARIMPEKASFFRYLGGRNLASAIPGTIDFFLIERYLLFSKHLGTLWKGRVYHRDYPLMSAEAHDWDDHLFEINGLKSPFRPPEFLHYSPGVDVNVYRMQLV
jgi:uncharacterized protein